MRSRCVLPLQTLWYPSPCCTAEAWFKRLCAVFSLMESSWYARQSHKRDETFASTPPNAVE